MVSRIQPNYSWQELTQAFFPAISNTEILENAFAQKTNAPFAIAFRYGRTGLYYLLRALGVTNKKVILPSYTCVVVAHAILESGNIPVFIDCPSNSPIATEEAFLQAIDDDTIMIIPTHVFGFTMRTSSLIKKIKSINPAIFVLQDCAHSFFAEDSEGNQVATLGDGALFGMNISKLVNSVKGGMLCLRNQQLADKIRSLRDEEGIKHTSVISRLYVLLSFFAFTYWGYKLTLFFVRNTRLLDSEVRYYQEGRNKLPSDFKYLMNNFEATIGLLSLGKYDKRISQRRELARLFIQGLKHDGLSHLLPEGHDTPGNTWSHFPLLLPASTDRDTVIASLEKKSGTEIGRIIDYTVGLLAGFETKSNAFQNSKAFSERVINLPVSLTECRLRFLPFSNNFIKNVKELI